MAGTRPKRPYHSPLRERQAAGTRREILEALADFIVTDGLTDFSMRDVAVRAGVSERTVYYHFPNRQAILEGLSEWVDDQLRERRLHIDPRVVDDVDVGDLLERLGSVFAAFDEIGAPARAMVRLSVAQGVRSADYHERTVAFRELFADALDPLPPAEAARHFAMLRHVLSSLTWVTLRDEFDLSAEDATRAITWALSTLLDALHRPAE